MDKKKLMELAERYQCKADTAFQNYQETGITRYDTARRNNEDMAEALRMAASAKEDHDRMIHLRGGAQPTGVAGCGGKPCKRRGSASEDAGGARRTAVCGPYAGLDPRRRR